QAPADVEELDGQRAHVAELVEEPARDLLGLTLQHIGPGGRSARGREDPSAVLVLRERIERRSTVGATNRDDRELPAERHDPLRELVVADLARRIDPALPFSVVPQPPRLDERGDADVVERP